MAKRIKTILKLQIPGGQATPAPPVGTALGPHGLAIGEFVQKFNEATKDRAGEITPVEITVYENRTYSFRLKTPPASYLLKKAAGIEKGSAEGQKTKVGKVTKEQVRQIAEKKLEDLNTQDLEQAVKIIEGTAKNMGLDVTE